MEDLLVRERAAESHVFELLKDREAPILSLPEAFNTYRHLCQAVVFADFQNARPKEQRLWQAHTDAKKLFHEVLGNLRKASNQPVETRQLMKLYLEFLKQSSRYYRGYIYNLTRAAGGIPELEAVAHQVKPDGNGESQPSSISPDLRHDVFRSCHQTLIYLGDLSRYRASEKLDKKPDYGPAIGFYGLACTLQPSSGIGHHQQAVVALEQRHHLRAIYHLYRAMNVDNPHPNAAQNLKLEFAKTNAAWDKGELIHKGPPKDPDAPKRALIGWFVRLHSMCYKGEPFRGYDELEREVLSQLTNEIKQHQLDGTAMRMVLVNIAAQFTAGEKFQANPIQQHQDAFLYFFRFNLRFFTVLLNVFYNDLRAKLSDLEDHDIELAAKLTPTICRILPTLRVYTNWLLPIVYMVVGLTADNVVGPAAEQFWQPYAKAIDLIAQAFPIWDLEDQPPVTYMLEEDVDTLGFKPLSGEKTAKTWYSKSTGALKPRFSDQNVVRVSLEDEMLERVKEFLADGLHIANNDEQAPIHLRGTRIFYGDESQIEKPVVPVIEYQPAPPAASEAPPQASKPISYAAAAANGHALKAQHATVGAAPNPIPPIQSRDAQLSRMVDDLVDDDEDNHPVTPPQQHAAHPTVVANGEVPNSLQDSVQDLGHVPKPPSHARALSGHVRSHIATTTTPPAAARPSPRTGSFGTRHDRLQSVSSLWGSAPSPSLTSGVLPTTAASAAAAAAIGSIPAQHSRVNSAGSVRSRSSHHAVDPWASPMDLGITQQLQQQQHPSDVLMGNTVPAPLGGPYAGMSQPKVASSPLLFGAGGTLWSPGFRGGGFRNTSPPHGPQGG